jgi:hypothetical protein
MAISGAELAKVVAGQSVAPAATFAKTSNVDAPTNTKHVAAGGSGGAYGPNLAGPGLTQASGGIRVNPGMGDFQ